MRKEFESAGDLLSLSFIRAALLVWGEGECKEAGAFS